jgi:hypothetical protein
MSAERYDLRLLVAASGLSYDDARRQVGASGADWAKGMRDGVSELKADRWSNRLGLVAYEVFPEILDAAVADIEQECAADGCERAFTVHQGRGGQNRRFCSDACRSREVMRQYRQTERGRMENRQTVRRYKQEVQELAQRRRDLRDRLQHLDPLQDRPEPGDKPVLIPKESPMKPGLSSGPPQVDKRMVDV